MACAVALVGTGCGISPDAEPRDLAEDERIIAVAGVPVGADAEGADRIYLVGPGEDGLLRSVPREAVAGLTLMEILLLGPNEAEIETQFSTVIPSGTRLLQPARSRGSFLFLDVSSEISELTGDSLVQALAQVVYTATELDGIEAVQLTVDGESLSWPKANGETTTGALRTYDYPGLVRTAQPDYPGLPSGV
ncbi:MAG: GerMN domain-containing protein [Ilumatobacter sp.]|uniref:GerMN domain-containing protein n=1 Tax=Ilumatobacter sp. TaxID=1967498 RepID=UPI0026255D00|nr:GerMN domain-containing protein [Ilumatobacter sp.]MDJ0768784.1 GerMN domain-containing protein [Ilumatobacter sp.]